MPLNNKLKKTINIPITSTIFFGGMKIGKNKDHDVQTHAIIMKLNSMHISEVAVHRSQIAGSEMNAILIVFSIVDVMLRAR